VLHAARWKCRMYKIAKNSPSGRGNCRICCLSDVTCSDRVPFRRYEGTARFLSLVTLIFDFCPWHSNSSERRTKHVFRVNLAQICSAVPAIHCGMRVPRSNMICLFRPFGVYSRCQMITVSYGVSGPKFTKFLCDVERTSTL